MIDFIKHRYAENETADFVVLQPLEDRAHVKMWTKGVPVEEKAKEQLINVATLPFIYRHVAAMPDVHVGVGATVGSVIATRGAVIPAAVGVDIGCGMIAARTSLTAEELPDNLADMRRSIEERVPHGNGGHGNWNDRNRDRRGFDAGKEWWNVMATDLRLAATRAVTSSDIEQLGTLGGGNHFVEICLDEEQKVWILLHSGSRGMGNRIGHKYIELAKKDMRRYHINLPDVDLAYIPEGAEHFDAYLQHVELAQEFAALNRKLMLYSVTRAMANTRGMPWFQVEETAINCHHNYISREHHFGNNVIITRKGAVSAREGELGIIPGSMGAKSFIVRGKGNPESFHSCSHGAGRKMSRTQARKTFTLDDHMAATEGVECRHDESVLDETPGAYKDIEAVMAAQSDLVDIVHTLKQVLCVKG